MPVFTIESTYHLPVFRHRSYSAPTLAVACRKAVADGDWSGCKEDRDGGQDSAYATSPLPVPAQFRETVERRADHFASMLALLKQLPNLYEGGLRHDLIADIGKAITKGEAIAAGKLDPA